MNNFPNKQKHQINKILDINNSPMETSLHQRDPTTSILSSSFDSVIRPIPISTAKPYNTLHQTPVYNFQLQNSIGGAFDNLSSVLGPMSAQMMPMTNDPSNNFAGSNIGGGGHIALSDDFATIPSVSVDVPIPQLQNIVCTVNLGCSLDLKDVALKSRNAEYNPKRFAAVIMRIREPRTTALIFSSGKMVCTGAKSEDDAMRAARKYARIIQKLGCDVHFKEFKIQNMVGSCDVKFSLRLEGLTAAHGDFCTYEPELFPGLIYRMTIPKIVLLIFVSGKVVLTGAKVREQIYEAFNNIYPVLKKFKKVATLSAGNTMTGGAVNNNLASSSSH